MKPILPAMLAAVLALSAAADVPLATSSTVAFALNTIDSSPFAVTTAAEAADSPIIR